MANDLAPCLAPKLGQLRITTVSNGQSTPLALSETPFQLRPGGLEPPTYGLEIRKSLLTTLLLTKTYEYTKQQFAPSLRSFQTALLSLRVKKWPGCYDDDSLECPSPALFEMSDF